MNGLLFPTIIVLSGVVAKFIAVPFRRQLIRHPELLPSVPVVFAVVAFAAGRYPLTGAGPVHFLFALVLDLIGWGVWAFLSRREVEAG